MALPAEDPGQILKTALDVETKMDLAAETAVPTVPEASVETIPVPILDGPQDTELVEPTQVAGIGDKIMGLARKMRPSQERILEAEKKVLPQLADEPIQRVGDTFLIRPMEQDEIDRIQPVFGGYDKGINFVRFAEDRGELSLAAYLEAIKDANKDLFEELRRGTLNFDALLAKANAKNVDSVLYNALNRKAGDTANAETILAEVLAAISLTKETQGAWLKAFAITEPVEKEAALRRAMQMMSVEAELYARTSAAGSEAGRTLYVLSQSQKMAGVDLGARGDQLRSLFGAATADEIEYVGQQYMTLRNPAARETFVKQGLTAKSMDVMAEVYVNSLLTNPVTHVVNVLGNASFMATRVLETTMAGAIGRVRSAITGNTDRVYIREAFAEIEGIRDGFMDSLVVAGKTLVTEEASDIASKIELRNRRAIGTSGDPAVIYDEFRNGNYAAGAVNVIGVAARMPGRFLLAEDEFFKGVGYRMFLHKEAKLQSIRAYDQAIEAGKTVDEALAVASTAKQRVLTDPPLDVVKSAREAAKEMTFQKDLGDGFLGAANEALSHPAAKLFVPFFKTPTNIAKAIGERTPLALLSRDIQAAIMRGGRDADVAMARIATGSMVMGSFATWAMGTETDGEILIHGAGPSEPTARQAWLRKGFLPYSISVKQDDGTYRSITYSRFDPVSGLLGIAADYAYYSQYENDTGQLDALAFAATMSVTNYMMEQPLLQGVNEIAAAFVIPNRKERTEKILKIMGEKAGAGALAFMPGTSAGSAAVTRYLDPTQRNTMVPAQGMFGEDVTQLPAMMQGFYEALQKAKAANPYFNASLPPKLNEWGEVMTVGSGEAWEFVSPVRIKNSVYQPVDDEILRLGKGFAPTPKKISGVDLNADQFNRMITLTNQIDEMGRRPGDKGYDEGSTLLPMLMRVIKDPGYKRLPTKDDQIDQITNVVSQYRSAARKMLLNEDPYLAAKVAAKP